MSTKPKRPPVVKTDWVAEVENKSTKHKETYYFGGDEQGAVKWAKEVKYLNTHKVTCIKRTWRKVDL